MDLHENYKKKSEKWKITTSEEASFTNYIIRQWEEFVVANTVCIKHANNRL